VDVRVHQALIAAEVDARRRHMVKHHGIGSAGHPYDGADWDNSRVTENIALAQPGLSPQSVVAAQAV